MRVKSNLDLGLVHVRRQFVVNRAIASLFRCDGGKPQSHPSRAREQHEPQKEAMPIVSIDEESQTTCIEDRKDEHTKVEVR